MFERLWNRLSFSLPRQSGNGVLPGEVKTAETNLAFPATCQQAAGALEGGELPFHAPNPTRHDTGLINTGIHCGRLSLMEKRELKLKRALVQMPRRDDSIEDRYPSRPCLMMKNR